MEERDGAWRRPRPAPSLLALEAVQAAKDQSLRASEALDRALRVALFGQSRSIGLGSVILEVAAEYDDVDPDALVKSVDDDRWRGR